MSEKISIIRMLSGVEIIGVIVADGTDQVKLRDPLYIQFQQKNPGEVAIALGQVAPFGKKTKGESEVLAFNSFLIEFDYEADEQISEQYKTYVRQKNSPLILPTDSDKIIKTK
jgi:hypothetical protein